MIAISLRRLFIQLLDRKIILSSTTFHNYLPLLEKINGVM